MKTILILMDTLQRKMIHAYNPGSEAITPNIDRWRPGRWSLTSIISGPPPVWPARRDILTGRLNFLERNWGSVEPFDVTFPALLRQRGVFSHMVTDHYHYTELGGEGYLQQYNTWELFRGQESDPWASRVKDPEMPAEFTGRVNRQNLFKPRAVPYRCRLSDAEDLCGGCPVAAGQRRGGQFLFAGRGL